MTGKEHSNVLLLFYFCFFVVVVVVLFFVLLLDLGDSHRDTLSCKTSSDYPHHICIKFKYEQSGLTW